MSHVYVFKVESTSRQGFKVDVRARKHEITVDEPKELGGTDLGPNPIELLLASLASCLSIAVRFHASRRNIRLDEVSVEASGELDIRGFMGVEGVKPGLKKIEVLLRIKSPEPEEKLRELLEFVEAHCPVADTLRSTTPIKLNLVKD